MGIFGKAVRLFQYDRSANERNAVSALKFMDQDLSWVRLDDGVMGGQSDTQHVHEDGVLHFKGTINTDGGGFTSIRTPITKGSLDSTLTGLRLKLKGDGKTYKLLLSDGNSGGPMAKSPSWQIDIPTKANGEWEEVDLHFGCLLPNFVGRDPLKEKDKYTFTGETMVQLGFMLSLKLSSGQPNPKETFGEGIFSFELQIKSIEPIRN